MPSIPSDPEFESGPGPLHAALLVSYFSAVWGVIGGGLSIVAGIAAHSTALVGTGADVVADLLSTIVLIWRFRVELGGHHAPHEVERRAQTVASTCLLVVAVGLTVAAAVRLTTDDGAEPSALSVVVAAASLVVLPLLAWAKYRAAAAVSSRALHTDGHISLLGGTTAALSLVGLITTSAFGWTAADPVAAIVVAVIAAITGGSGLRAVRT